MRERYRLVTNDDRYARVETATHGGTGKEASRNAGGRGSAEQPPDVKRSVLVREDRGRVAQRLDGIGQTWNWVEDKALA